MNKIISFGYEGNDNPYELLINQELRTLGYQIDVASRSGFLPIFKAITLFGRPDIIHLHWLEPLIFSPRWYKTPFKTLTFCSEIILIKFLGIKLIWTVHNLTNHNRTQILWEKIAQKVTFTLSNRVIVHCKNSKKELSKKLNTTFNNKIFIIPHHNYGNFYPNLTPKSEAKKVLNLPKNKRIVLFLGTIRSYKGIKRVLNPFINSDFKKLHFVIAGWGEPKYIATLKRIIGESSNITLIDNKLSNEEVALYFSASDAVTLPYKEVLTSGSLLLAMNYAKPIVASNSGCIKNYISIKGGIVVKDEYKWSKALEILENIDLKLLKAMGKYNHQKISSLTPEYIATKISLIYQNLIKPK